MSNAKPAVIVTGTSGFIGRAVCDAFLKDGYLVAGLDRPDTPNAPSGIENIPCDVTSEQSTADALTRVRQIFGDRLASVIHLAAYYDFSGEPSPLYEEVTIRGTERLLRLLKPFKVEQFVFSSTMLVHAPCQPGEHIHDNGPVEAKWDYPDSKLQTERLHTLPRNRGGHADHDFPGHRRSRGHVAIPHRREARGTASLANVLDRRHVEER